MVSIHALTKSATFCSIIYTSNFYGFNPRTHEECDCRVLYALLTSYRFNPRTHEECDLYFFFYHSVKRLFQSTHSRRVRPSPSTFIDFLDSFNPRTHEECDDVFVINVMGENVSIHALTKSATLNFASLLLYCVFQSTHSRRVRP